MDFILATNNFQFQALGICYVNILPFLVQNLPYQVLSTTKLRKIKKSCTVWKIMPKQSSFSCRIIPISSRGQNLNLDYTARWIRLKWHCISFGRISRKIIFLEEIWTMFFFLVLPKMKETHTLQSFFDNNQSLNQTDCDLFFPKILNQYDYFLQKISAISWGHIS